MIEAVRSRRSIRRYSDEPITERQVRELQESVLRAPSSRNLQPWRFVFVTEPTMLEKLSHAKAQWGEFLAQAPLGIVICGRESVSDCWIEDCSIAATILQLTATELGLGSCWIQIRGRQAADGSSAEQRVLEVLELPPTLRVLSILAVGHPAEQKAPKDAEKLSWDAIESRGSIRGA